MTFGSRRLRCSAWCVRLAIGTMTGLKLILLISSLQPIDYDWASITNTSDTLSQHQHHYLNRRPSSLFFATSPPQVRHRGPDGSGIHVVEDTTRGRASAIAHERLAIVDPLSGNQPLFSHDMHRWVGLLTLGEHDQPKPRYLHLPRYIYSRTIEAPNQNNDKTNH